jgi:hypothetical protein
MLQLPVGVLNVPDKEYSSIILPKRFVASWSATQKKKKLVQ